MNRHENTARECTHPTVRRHQVVGSLNVIDIRKWLLTLAMSAILTACQALPELQSEQEPPVPPEEGPPASPSPPPPPPLDVESIYYDQPRLVRKSLDNILDSKEGLEETYFVGFGSSDEHEVFEKEIKLVEAQFREQLGAEGRTAMLINSRNTVKDFPLANGPNLEALLDGIAEKMGPEDVLYLHMTSHGSMIHDFSVRLGDIPMNDLSSRRMGEIVNRDDIPWQVTLIMSCYSGGYIENLKSPRSVIITASRADRVSFGCEHGRDFSDFTEFYYGSLVDHDYQGAFERALPLVEKREAERKVDRSYPQIWIGHEISDKLGFVAPSESYLSTRQGGSFYELIQIFRAKHREELSKEALALLDWAILRYWMESHNVTPETSDSVEG